MIQIKIKTEIRIWLLLNMAFNKGYEKGIGKLYPLNTIPTVLDYL